MKFFCWLMCLTTVAFADSHNPEDFLKSIRGTKDEGAQIVQQFCINCHAEKPLINLGAPRIGVSADWQLRLKQGIDSLMKHTDEGINAMPPRGGCFECSDEQLMLAILAMLPEKEKNSLSKDLKVNKKSIKVKK